jgi:hypothetical protein
MVVRLFPRKRLAMRMKAARATLVGMLVSGVLCVPARADEAARQAPAGTAGMQDTVEPRDGAQAPAASAPSVAESAARSRSAAGLVEQAAPGGGVMVDLQGRFQSPLVAHVGGDGQQDVSHPLTGAAPRGR